MDRQLTELCGALRDETISEDDFAALESRLAADAEARDFYLRFTHLHALLEELPPLAEEEDASPAERVVAFPKHVVTATLTAAACLALALIANWRSTLVVDYAGTLIFSEDCRWKTSRSPVEGQRLAVRKLHLLEGIAVIRFDGGAEVTLSGDTHLDLLSPGSARLHHGEVVVRAESGAEGFLLDTPASEVIDLGTEFAVKVESSGATEVHVHDGEVEYHDNEILVAGKAVRFDQANAAPHEVALNAPRFNDVVRKANPRPRADLMHAYAGFHYEPGPLPLAESTRGHGWTGPWRLRHDEERRRPETESTPDHLEIVHGEMNVTWPVPGGRLGMLEMPGGSFYVRDLAKRLPMDGDRIFFFSLMVRETERVERKRHQPQEALRLTFRDSRDYFGESITFGHGPEFAPRIQTGPGMNTRSPFLLPPEQTTLWIGKIIARRHGEDEISFRVYGEKDALDYAEPATWHVTTRGLDLDARFDRVLISSTGISTRIVDELRIGPTWRSVAPINANNLDR